MPAGQPLTGAITAPVYSNCIAKRNYKANMKCVKTGPFDQAERARANIGRFKSDQRRGNIIINYLFMSRFCLLNSLFIPLFIPPLYTPDVCALGRLESDQRRENIIINYLFMSRCCLLYSFLFPSPPSLYNPYAVSWVENGGRKEIPTSLTLLINES